MELSVKVIRGVAVGEGLVVCESVAPAPVAGVGLGPLTGPDVLGQDAELVVRAVIVVAVEVIVGRDLALELETTDNVGLKIRPKRESVKLL